MAEITATAGTGPIATGASTPMDKLLEQLVNSTLAPTINSLLDVTGSTTKDSTESSTGVKTSTETGTGTKTSATSAAAQALLDQQIASLQASLTDNNQYGQLIGNIMNEAAKGFNPTNAVSRRSGAYNSTTLDQLRNDATAKATSQASEAVLADKRAKLTQLVELIGQNVNANKTESTATSQAGTTNANQTNTGTEKTTVEANRIGSGAANAAKVGAAALMAKSLLGTDAGKTMTEQGVGLLKKLLDASGGSTGLPANWFDDLSSVVADPSAISSSYDDVIKGIFGDVTETGLPDGWFDEAGSELFSSSGEFTSFLNSSGVSASQLGGWSGPLAALTNAADGEWGWNDTGSTVGSVVGSIFGPWGSAAGSALGSLGGEAVGKAVESGAALLNSATLGLGDVISDAVGGVGDFVDDLFGGGCFITTACMKVLQATFDDKCHELEAMRDLRDNYIAHLPVGKEIIEAYYILAPEIIKRIESFDNATEIWAGLYETFISTCVNYVDEGQYKKAYLTYLHMIQYVQLTTGVGE